MNQDLKSPFCSKAFVPVLILMLGSWTIGAAMSFASPLNERMITDLGYTPSELGLLGSLTSLTAMLGPLITTPAVNFRGKRFTCELISVLNVFAYLLVLGASERRRSLPIVNRAISGFAAGALSSVIPTFIMDCGSAETRDIYGAMHQVGMSLGIIFTAGAGAFIPWKLLAVLETVPSILLLLLIGSVPESTQRIGRMALLDEEPPTKRWRCSQKSWNAITVFLFFFFQQGSGVNAMLNYLQDNLVYRTGPIIATSSQVLGLIFSFVLLIKVGRRWTWVISCVGTIVAMSISTYIVSWEQRTNDETKATIVAAFVFLMFYTIGLGPIPFLVLGDLFPEVTQASVFSSIMWFMSFVVITLTRNMVMRIGRDTTLMGMMAVVLVGTFVGGAALSSKKQSEPLSDMYAS